MYTYIVCAVISLRYAEIRTVSPEGQTIEQIKNNYLSEQCRSLRIRLLLHCVCLFKDNTVQQLS